VRDADRRQARALALFDAYISLARIDAPADEPPAAVAIGAVPSRVSLRGRVSTVLWATGYRREYPWLHEPVLDAAGELVHRQGVTAVPGLLALGLRFQRTRSSHFLGGVGDDAAHIARAIVARASGAPSHQRAPEVRHEPLPAAGGRRHGGRGTAVGRHRGGPAA
jgi:putative flavoprotein involved in K+ transport